jgi:hypothetical protein
MVGPDQAERCVDGLTGASAAAGTSATWMATRRRAFIAALGGARVESKRVDAFENMSDEELRQYVYGTRVRQLGHVGAICYPKATGACGQRPGSPL